MYILASVTNILPGDWGSKIKADFECSMKEAVEEGRDTSGTFEHIFCKGSRKYVGIKGDKGRCFSVFACLVEMENMMACWCLFRKDPVNRENLGLTES